MKIRRIPETDLARTTVRPIDEQRIWLRQLRDFRPPHTLNPFRSAVPDLVNLQHEMLGGTEPTRWEIIQAAIEKSKEGPDGIAMNFSRSRRLYTTSVERMKLRPTQSRRRNGTLAMATACDFGTTSIPSGEGAGAFVHFDPRLTHPLTAEARRFAFSLMQISACEWMILTSQSLSWSSSTSVATTRASGQLLSTVRGPWTCTRTTSSIL